MPEGSAFRRLWAASAASNLGDGVGLVVIPLLAATLTRDPLWISTIAAVAFLPYLVLSAPVGVLVDRVERRRAMLWANGLRVLVLAVLVVLVAVDRTTLWAVALAAFLLGAAECAFDLAAEAALPELVVSADLDAANSRLQTTMYVSNMFLGGPVGAALFSLAAVVPFGAQLVGHMAAAGLVAGLPAAPPPPADDPAESSAGAWSELRAAVGWLLGNAAIRSLAVVTSVIAFGQVAGQSIAVLFVLETLNGSDLSFGLLTAVSALGAVAGSTLAPRVAARIGRPRAMLLAAVGLPVTMAGIGLAPGLLVAMLVVPVFSASIGLWNVMSVSLRQELVPAAYAGRVFGAWRTVVMGALPLGAWAGGAIADRWGLRAPWLVGAGLCALGAVLAAGALQPGRSGSRASVSYCDDAFQSRKPSPPAS